MSGRSWGISGYSLHAQGRILFIKATSGASLIEALRESLEAQDVKAAVILGIGGLKRAKLGFYNPKEARYETLELAASEDEILELASLTGNTVRGPDGKYYTHLHAVIASSSKVWAGHLIEAKVDPLLEAVVIELTGGYERLSSLLSHRWSRV